MDTKYKACIVELEFKDPVMPPEQHEARIQELKTTLETITLQLEDAKNLLKDATATWTAMEEIPDLVTFHEQVQRTQQDLEVVIFVMTDLPPLQRMLKMGENKKLQGELQKLRTHEKEYLKTVEP